MLTLSQPEDIAMEVIGSRVRLGAGQSAADIPGWDSLNNTLIALDISSACDVEFSGEDMAACASFGALIDAVNARIAASARG